MPRSPETGQQHPLPTQVNWKTLYQEKSMIDEIEAYMNRRSTDRELNRSVRQMLLNVYNLYRVEISKLQIK
jgi:hypothetical protein